MLGIAMGLAKGKRGVSGGSGFVDASTTGPRTSLIRVPQDATSGTGWVWNGVDLHVLPDAGATVSGLDVSGPIMGGTGRDNVIVRDCKVNANQFRGITSGSSGWLVEYCEVVNPGLTSGDGIFAEGPNWTVRYNDVSGLENGIICGGQTTVEYNYVHDMIPYDPVDDPHVDGIQLFGAFACNGSIIRYNNIICPGDATSAFIMGASTNVTIQGNRFIGGGWTAYLYYDDTNSFINNRLDGGGLGYLTENGGTGTPTISGNVDDSSGLPI